MDAIVFLGIQGSGKGTQAKLLSELTGFLHVNIGELLRMQTHNGSDSGYLVKETITRGELVSDEMAISLIAKESSLASKGIIFDGFPRTQAQALVLLGKYNLLRVYYLDLSEEDAVKRLSARRTCQNCGATYNLITHRPTVENTCDSCRGLLFQRPDDEPAAIRKRIAEFFRQTHKLKDLFIQHGLLVAVSANATIDHIAEVIRQDVKSILQR